jgi:hypothetical protein
LPSFEQALSLIKFLDVEGEMTGSGVRVVFIDSGCGRGLPLRDCINLTESSDIDTEGHGSAVHAVLASMLPDAEIYLVKVPDPLPDHVLITALNEAHKLLPHAINLSITSEIPSDGSDPASTYVNHVRLKVCCRRGRGERRAEDDEHRLPRCCGQRRHRRGYRPPWKALEEVQQGADA